MKFTERLRAHAARHPGRPALVSASRQLGYRELADQVQAACAALRARGIGPGAVVGVTLAEEIDHLVATLAVLDLGAIQVTLASDEPPRSRRALAERVGASWVLAQPDCLHDLPLPAVDWSGLDLAGLSREGLPSAATPRSGALYLVCSRPGASAAIVALSTGQLALQADRYPQGGGRLLSLIPVEREESRRDRLCRLWTGGTNVFPPRGPFDLAAYCQRQAVDLLEAPAALPRDARLPGSTVLVAPGLRVAALASPAERGADGRLAPEHCYAPLECGPVALAQPGTGEPAGSPLRPLPGVELQVVIGGTPVPAGEVGEIRLRAPGMASYYLDEPERTHQAFRDGWFHTGALGALRPDGLLQVLGQQTEALEDRAPTAAEPLLEPEQVGGRGRPPEAPRPQAGAASISS